MKIQSVDFCHGTSLLPDCGIRLACVIVNGYWCLHAELWLCSISLGSLGITTIIYYILYTIILGITTRVVISV